MDTTYLDVIVMAHVFNDNTLINLGTYTMDQFKAAYNEVLDHLKINYPGVPIILYGSVWRKGTETAY